MRLLITIMFHNLYPFSSIGYMNLGRALFLHDLITDEEIDICSHIFHILRKNAERTASRNCLPFCCFISKNLKLKGIHPLEDEYPILCKVQSTFALSMLSLVIVERASSKRVMLLMVVQVLAHIPMIKSWTT